MSARVDVAEYWDAVVARFLDGDIAFRPEPLERWFRAYVGRAGGEVVVEALPEPYIGDLLSRKSRAVTLALNPGEARLDFQGRQGVFANEIRTRGSYHLWAATLPYFGAAWRRAYGKNRFHESRRNFLRAWFGPDFCDDEMVCFELYPWHSKSVKGEIRPDPGIVRDFIWKPIADMGNPFIFGFGAPWVRFVQENGLTIERRLGLGGVDYGSSVPSRSVIVARTTEGGIVIVEKHSGSAGPPSRDETHRLREYLVSEHEVGF